MVVVAAVVAGCSKADAETLKVGDLYQSPAAVVVVAGCLQAADHETLDSHVLQGLPVGGLGLHTGELRFEVKGLAD